MGAIKKMTTRKSKRNTGYHGPLIIKRDEAPPASKHLGKRGEKQALEMFNNYSEVNTLHDRLLPSSYIPNSTFAKLPNNKTSYSHLTTPLTTILILNISRQP